MWSIIKCPPCYPSFMKKIIKYHNFKRFLGKNVDFLLAIQNPVSLNANEAWLEAIFVVKCPPCYCPPCYPYLDNTVDTFRTQWTQE